MASKDCSICGETFDCCGDSEDASCWCAQYPPIMPLVEGRQCRCPACLKNAIQERIAEFLATVTPENALTCGATKYAGSDSLIEDIDYTLNADGNMVLSPWYLLKRGNCCETGCTNCPYGYKGA